MTDSLHSNITNPALLKRIAEIKNLPTLPETYSQLISELSNAEVAMNKVAVIISHDVAIAAKLLQVANSALFGLRTPAETVLQALNFLGVETVKGIVLAAGVYQLEGVPRITGFLPQEIYARAVDVGAKSRFIASALGLRRQDIEDALTAGLLHDVGKLVLLTSFMKEFRESLALGQSKSIALHEAEELILGANDAAIGAYLLTTWSLPKSIVDAVAAHYTPSRLGKPAIDASTAVHAAWASEEDRRSRARESAHSAFDITYTDALGITEALRSFVRLAPEAVGEKTPVC